MGKFHAITRQLFQFSLVTRRFLCDRTITRLDMNGVWARTFLPLLAAVAVSPSLRHTLWAAFSLTLLIFKWAITRSRLCMVSIAGQGFVQICVCMKCLVHYKPSNNRYNSGTDQRCQTCGPGFHFALSFSMNHINISAAFICDNTFSSFIAANRSIRKHF